MRVPSYAVLRRVHRRRTVSFPYRAEGEHARPVPLPRSRIDCRPPSRPEGSRRGRAEAAGAERPGRFALARWGGCEHTRCPQALVERPLRRGRAVGQPAPHRARRHTPGVGARAGDTGTGGRGPPDRLRRGRGGGGEVGRPARGGPGGPPRCAPRLRPGAGVLDRGPPGDPGPARGTQAQAHRRGERRRQKADGLGLLRGRGRAGQGGARLADLGGGQARRRAGGEGLG